MSVSRDVRDQADDLIERYEELTSFEALQIAARIVEIEAFKEANNVGREKTIPSLEAIAMCLGMDKQFSYTIPKALSDVASAMNDVAEAMKKRD